ncbi:MAG: SWIM zinc finger family protein [Chloroflexi bacterium]|nr:SWIM zinc finger family protein [Chloroflexota bacterium]
MRQDLLALTADDLVLLANRGLVKRAQQEVQSAELTCTIDEDAQGTVTIAWSDAIECVLPGGKHVREARCSCPAGSICRHILRSVLAYQQAATQSASDETSPAAPPAPWNPGSISDEELSRALSRTMLTWAKRQLDEPQVVELVCSVKPTAFLHTLNCMVRFLVPGDPRYTHCDCAEEAPCRHVALAVWAFRQLQPEQSSGLIEFGAQQAAVPTTMLDEIERDLRDLVGLGMAGAPQALIERLRRQEERCRQEGLVWPAEILAEIVQQHTAYTSHDARFGPAILSSLIGELCVRSDAIRGNTGAVPQIFIRGAAADTKTAMGTARLIGLGCGVKVRRGGTELTAYLQDSTSGTLVAISREVSAETAATSRFARLAQFPITAGAGVAALGSGQALIKGGQRLPNARFLPARAKVNVNPQMYAWESLRPPLLAEDFAELDARIAAQPPAALRPRRLTDRLYVCAVAGARDAVFSEVDQEVRAVLVDPQGGQAILIHPYTAQGASGAEALLSLLRSRPESLRFVAGHVRRTPYGLVIAPTAVVYQQGETRRALLPWVDREEGSDETTVEHPPQSPQSEPLAEYWTQVNDALGDLFVVGLQRADVPEARRWQELARFGAALGFARSIEPVTRLAAALEQKGATLHWEPDQSVAAALELACLTEMINTSLVQANEAA